MKEKVFMRSLAGFALFISILFLPWWATLALLVVFSFVFDAYYEAIAAGFLLDTLYGAPRDMFYGFEFVGTMGAGLIFFAALYAKTKLRYYT